MICRRFTTLPLSIFNTMALGMTIMIMASTLLPATMAAGPVGKFDDLVPRHLLGLVHAPEVHAELKLNDEQVRGLETLFHEIDARWFPARILPADKKRETIHELEQQVLDWFRENTTNAQQQRLQQLEYYAQSGRMLLRQDVSRRIGLGAPQQEKLAELARATDAAGSQLNRTQFGDPAAGSLQAKFNKATRAERAGLMKYVRPPQRKKLNELLGDAFNPSRLKRVYAMAPEFAEVDHWINSSPLRMSELRGKVLLIHFYAFQCHNCHANFGIYQRWHQELTDKGVVVIGIQTPETKPERDPVAIEEAAKERKLDFPILVDLDSQNWKAWGNTMWPCVYVVDQDGYIRHWWQGELNWKGATADKTIEQVVDGLLRQ